MRASATIWVGLVAMGWALGANAGSARTGTLTLDGLSYISFDGTENLPVPAGSRVRFQFEQAAEEGSVSFDIAPSDLHVGPILLDSQRTLTYALVRPTNGTMRRTSEGWTISFTAVLNATLHENERKSSQQHVIRFTTETASAHNRAGTKEVSVAGMRGEPTARYVQLVGATTNPKLSYPKPGAAVYVVLSGTFDVLPDGS